MSVLRRFLASKRVDCEEPAPAGLDPANLAPKSEEGPMQYENYSKEWQQITMQDNFDGFRLEAGKAVSKLLQASHSLFLGTSLRECGYIYQFGPTFQSEDGNTVLVGRLGLDGAVSARAIKKLGMAELKVNANSSLKDPRRNMYEFSADLNGADWASTVKFAWQSTWIMNVAFSQMITKKLHAGGEFTWVAVNGATIGAIGARHAAGKNIWSATLSRQPDFKNGPSMAMSHSGKVQYVRKVSDRLSLGSELEYTHPDMESTMKVGYEYAFRQARVQGMLDTAGRVSCFVQDYMGFGFSGMVDFLRSDYKFGFMMHVVPPPENGEPARF